MLPAISSRSVAIQPISPLRSSPGEFTRSKIQVPSSVMPNRSTLTPLLSCTIVTELVFGSARRFAGHLMTLPLASGACSVGISGTGYGRSVAVGVGVSVGVGVFVNVGVADCVCVGDGVTVNVGVVVGVFVGVWVGRLVAVAVGVAVAWAVAYRWPSA